MEIKGLVSSKDYPGTLDTVNWGKKEYQVAGQVQNPLGKDTFLLKDLDTNELVRVKGSFQRHKTTKDPISPKTLHLEEGVRTTGKIKGKKI